jgi:signal transduction histidine kinase
MTLRRTVRFRLTVLYSGLFLACGVLVLAIANVGARSTSVAGPKIRFGFPGKPLPPVSDHGLDRLAISSIVALAVMLVLSIALGWVVAGRGRRPRRPITATARAITATNRHERHGLEGADEEFRELGATLDDLFGRLESSFESQRHFVANASHELRTPLTAERALLQVALADPDATAGSLRAACEEVLSLGSQQERLIDSLLTLATGERGVDVHEPVDLAAVVEKVVAERRDEADARGLEVRTALGAARTTGDPGLLESLVTNLVDNALRHNVPDGRVDVSTTTTLAGQPTVSISNTGPQIAPEQVDRLFRPFERLAQGRAHHREGHGLGLAIVGAIAAGHGATIDARARPDGGLQIEVSFARAV